MPLYHALTRRTLLAGTASVLLAAPAIVRAQGGPLKVGVLLPRSGAQAGIGQDCFRGVELTNPILKDIGLGELAFMNASSPSPISFRIGLVSSTPRKQSCPMPACAPERGSSTPTFSGPPCARTIAGAARSTLAVPAS